MKKTLLRILSLALTAIMLFSVTACTQEQATTTVTDATTNAQADATPDSELEIKIYALNGTTALGMAQMIDSVNNDTAKMNYDISLHASADAITGAILTGECAIAALPTNVAVKLFNKSQGKLQLLATLFVDRNIALSTYGGSLGNIYKIAISIYIADTS